MSTNKPILIVDGMNFFIRYYVANPTMNTDGQNIGGIIGFIRALNAITKIHLPQKVFVIWESGGSQRRRQMYPDYKKGRKPIKLNRTYDLEDDLNSQDENKTYQINVLTKMLRCLPVCQVYVENCEADDVIGYLCTQKYRDSQKIIISSDKDFYQLLNSTTKIYRPGKKIYVTEESVIEEYNISPNNFLVARSCDGDQSDNIGGIPGVGLKSMAKRFSLNGSDVSIKDLMEACQEKSEEKKAPKIYENILSGEDIVKRNYKLMDLDCAMLSVSQVNKINDTISAFVPYCNKMKFLKRYIKFCSTGLDCDNICTSFYYLALKK